MVLASRFIVGSNVGIPAALLVILFRLYKIMALDSTSLTKVDKRRNVIIDLSIGLSLPLIQMPLRE
jgi:pheromone a factor receptor